MDILFITTGYVTPYESDRNNHAISHLIRDIQALGNSTYVILNDISYRTITRRENIKYYLKREICEYDVENTKTLYCPIQTLIPYTNIISPISLILTKKRIKQYIMKHQLNPDLILVHMGTRQYPIVKWMEDNYGWDGIFTFHNTDLNHLRVVRKIIKSKECYGVRSGIIGQRISNKIENNCHVFQVYSGCPDDILNLSEQRFINITKPSHNFRLLYAGRLLPGKKIDIVLKALAKLKDKYDFTFDIVGSGDMYNELVKYVDILGLNDRVFFHGEQKREYVLDMMLKSDCFIMVSESETLGVVYLEALGAGCFVIGSKGEGIDGIINDKENGLLVIPNSVDDLISSLEYYFNLGDLEFKQIMESARHTALEYTESSVAKRYINDVLNCGGKR